MLQWVGYGLLRPGLGGGGREAGRQPRPAACIMAATRLYQALESATPVDIRPSMQCIVEKCKGFHKGLLCPSSDWWPANCGRIVPGAD